MLQEMKFTMLSYTWPSCVYGILGIIRTSSVFGNLQHFSITKQRISNNDESLRQTKYS